MAYQSLYRKYRPQRFSELVGQEHVSTALRNAVRDGRSAMPTSSPDPAAPARPPLPGCSRRP